MKKLLGLLFIVCLITITSCNDALNPAVCQAQVQVVFPKCVVVPESKFVFTVTDTIGRRIYRVKTQSLSSATITSIILVGTY